MNNVIRYLKLSIMFVLILTASIYAEPSLTVDGLSWDHVMTEDIIPDTSNSYDLGSAAFPIAELHVSTGSVFLGTNELTAVGSSVGDLLYNGISISGRAATNFYVETNTLHTGIGDATAPIEHMIFSNVPPGIYEYHMNTEMFQTTFTRTDRIALRIDAVELPLTERLIEIDASKEHTLNLYGVINITGVVNVVIDVIRDGEDGGGNSLFTNRNFSLQEVDLGTF